jgi:hypothetical protein
MWKGEFLLISEAPVAEPFSIAELESGDHVVRFCDLGLLDRRNPKLSGINAGPNVDPQSG